ncbi:DUF433 domain-containing protein [Sorangium sp. So ce131]|uniref:DUF433 domain-containing protein n=1 Tax=Sorangium sp. So ce131 TaxID=3133282 RepID=UPI003F642A28
MPEWAYKVTGRKKPDEDTTRLADAFGFVARSAYRRMKNDAAGGAVGNVKRVRPGDVLHVYYIHTAHNERRHRLVGTYRVLDPASLGGRFEPLWPERNAALARVIDLEDNRGLLDALREQPASGEGYRPDPKLGVFTGWCVERAHGLTAPEFEDINFHGRHGRHTLVRVDGDLGERRSAEGELLSRIVRSPEVMGGRPCIRGTRVTVGAILSLLSVGHSFEAVLEDYPYLQEADLRAALAYAAWFMSRRDPPREAA